MWEFLGTALEKGGLVGLAMAMIFIMFGGTVRALWQQNQSLHAKVEALQEKRVAETKEVGEIVLENMRELDRSLETVSNLMDSLSRYRSSSHG